MSVIYISDFDMRGSGYQGIAVNLCLQMAQRGIDVIVLGLGYKNEEHHWPFRITPAEIPHLGPMVRSLQAGNVKIDAVIVALDIPLQERVLAQLKAPGDLPYVGIFPLESGPLCMPWAMSLLKMSERLVMSRCALGWMETAGIDGTFIPIGVDTAAWRPSNPNDRVEIRKGLGIPEDTFVILTVADNQERKNLSRSLEIVADFSIDVQNHDPSGYPSETESKRDTLYYLVTRPRSIVGYKLDDYAARRGIFDRLAMWNRGVPQKALWSLFVAADVFLLTSKAEGLGMPVLEAMACRLPVVGTNCTAIAEHLGDGRGLLIDPEYSMIDPWGNSMRYMASRAGGVDTLERLVAIGDDERETMLDAAQAYANARTWEQAADVLIAAIGRAQASIIVPSAVPVEENIEQEEEAQAEAAPAGA